jgi:hypothetical protein
MPCMRQRHNQLSGEVRSDGPDQSAYSCDVSSCLNSLSSICRRFSRRAPRCGARRRWMRWRSRWTGRMRTTARLRIPPPPAAPPAARRPAPLWVCAGHCFEVKADNSGVQSEVCMRSWARLHRFAEGYTSAQEGRPHTAAAGVWNRVFSITQVVVASGEVDIGLGTDTAGTASHPCAKESMPPLSATGVMRSPPTRGGGMPYSPCRRVSMSTLGLLGVAGVTLRIWRETQGLRHHLTKCLTS